jgi:zinc protease
MVLFNKPSVRRFAFTISLLSGLAQGALAQQAGAPAPVSTPAARSYAISDGRTPGGIRLVHILLKGEKDQSFSMTWRDRLIQHAPEKAGLLQLAPALVAAGGAGPLDAGALEEELKDIGGYFSLSRGRAAAFGDVVAPIEQFEATLKLLRSALTEPRMPAITLERRKRFLLNGRKANREKAESLAREAMTLALTGDHPVAATVSLTPLTTVTSVTTADVDGWRKAILARSNLTVTAAGPLTREAAADLVDSTFGGLPEKDDDRDGIPFINRPPLAKTIVIESPVAQSAILAGGPVTWSNGGAEGISRSLAISVLGGGSRSRLFIAIREKLGAAYGASASISAILGREGIFGMEAAVANDKVAAALAAMRSEYAAFREKGVTADEIDPIKRRMVSSFPETMRRAGSASSTIRGAIQNGLPFDAPDRQTGWINGQTVDGINALIRERLPEKLTVIVVAPTAAGLGADCVIKSLDELKTCLAP